MSLGIIDFLISLNLRHWDILAVTTKETSSGCLIELHWRESTWETGKEFRDNTIEKHGPRHGCGRCHLYSPKGPNWLPFSVMRYQSTPTGESTPVGSE